MATHDRAEGDDERAPAPVVEVVYALPDRQFARVLPLPAAGLSAAQAVTASGVLDLYPDLAGRDLALGIYGQICEPSRQLQPGDRVEIYRPLRNDPRVMRRDRAALSRRSGRRS